MFDSAAFRLCKSRAAMVALAAAVWWSPQPVEAARNILLVIADDYGIDSNSLYNSTPGASLPPTPTINALKSSGVLFRNACANPTCSPTRCCIHTGRQAFRTGVGQQITSAADAQLTASEFTLPEAFAANSGLGYQLALFGKWHLNNGVNSPGTIGGWPHFAGFLVGAVPSYTNWTKTVDGVQTANTNYTTTEFVNDAVAWINARGAQPWFVYLAFNAPHTPFHKPPTNLITAPYTALSGTQANINANPRPYYEAATQAMDTELARLFAQTGVNAGNTDIIFLGDNGTPSQVVQAPFPSTRAKDTIYEGGIHVPLIIAGPDVVNPNRESTATVNGVDLFGTILELAGINLTATLPTDRSYDTKSLLPILKNTADATRYGFSEQFGSSLTTAATGRTVRTEQYKLLLFGDGRREFYDLANDPAEASNLLTGALSADQQQNYSLLNFQLATDQETLATPVVTTQGFSGSQYVVTVARDTTMTYELWRGSDLSSTGWVPVSNAIIATGATTVTLTDPTPGAGKQFYRVLATKL
jgi:arylsulfatase A-like enzyme